MYFVQSMCVYCISTVIYSASPLCVLCLILLIFYLEYTFTCLEIDSMQHSYIHYRSSNSIDELVQADTLVLLEGGLSSCSYVNVSSTITNVNC